MKIDEAIPLLSLKKQQMKQLKKDIETISNFLRANGIDPNPPRDRTEMYERNKQMYKMWKDGWTFSAIAKDVRLNPNRVIYICRHIDRILEDRTYFKNPKLYDVYKELEKYK